MIQLTRWERSDTFDPFNTSQMIQEHYAGQPGDYWTWYFNQIPNDTTLMGIVPESTGGKVAFYGVLGLAGLAAGVGIGLAVMKSRKPARRRGR